MTLTKSSLRSSCITKRDAISIENHETWSFAVCEKLATYLSTLPVTGKQLALYNATHSELDIAPVLHALDAEGITVGLPVVQTSSRELAFYRFFSTLPMTQGTFGILEPQHFEQIIPDIIIVPLVGFDRTGQRLGYGKGYYDATLTALRRTNPTLLVIGVAFSAQEVDSIPVDRHDEKLNLIITEKEIITV